MHAMDAKMVTIIVLAAVLAAILLHRLLIIRRDNLWRRLFGFIPNPHDRGASLGQVHDKLDAAFSGVCDAERELQMAELAVESARIVAAKERRRLWKMQGLARSSGFEFVWRRT